MEAASILQRRLTGRHHAGGHLHPKKEMAKARRKNPEGNFSVCAKPDTGQGKEKKKEKVKEKQRKRQENKE